jgi:hypothetical protein
MLCKIYWSSFRIQRGGDFFTRTAAMTVCMTCVEKVKKSKINSPTVQCTVGWVDIGTRTKVPLKFVTYLSKITKINKKSVLTQ